MEATRTRKKPEPRTNRSGPLNISSVTLLGQPFRVETVASVDEEGSLGETLGDSHRIRISSDLDSRRWASVLMHEAVHAVLHVNGVGNRMDEDIEEVIAQSIEYGMTQLLQQHGDKLLAALRK